jgi:hypothetical protein
MDCADVATNATDRVWNWIVIDQAIPARTGVDATEHYKCSAIALARNTFEVPEVQFSGISRFLEAA